MTSEKAPPGFASEKQYLQWRQDIEMWQLSTTLEPQRQALAVRTKLSGKARSVALKIDSADLNTENGMGILLDKLDSVFSPTATKNSGATLLNTEKLTIERNRRFDKPPDASATASLISQANKSNRFDLPPQKPPDIMKKRVSKFDQPPSSAAATQLAEVKSISVEDPVNAAERARQRALLLSAKLRAEGKSILSTAIAPQVHRQNMNPADMVKNIKASAYAASTLPEVKRLDLGGYFAEYDINDTGSRAFLTRGPTQQLIASQSGASVTVKGRYMSAAERQANLLSRIPEKSLFMYVCSDIAAKVQVAVHKIADVIKNFELQGPNSSNNYGLTGMPMQAQKHVYLQDKIFIGFNTTPEFNLKSKVEGEKGSNMTYISTESNAKAHLRGKGSGYLEPTSGRESFEALHIFISHTSQPGLNQAKELARNLIDTIRSDYEQYIEEEKQKHHQNQLRLQPQPLVMTAYTPSGPLRYQGPIGNGTPIPGTGLRIITPTSSYVQPNQMVGYQPGYPSRLGVPQQVDYSMSTQPIPAIGSSASGPAVRGDGVPLNDFLENDPIQDFRLQNPKAIELETNGSRHSPSSRRSRSRSPSRRSRTRRTRTRSHTPPKRSRSRSPPSSKKRRSRSPKRRSTRWSSASRKSRSKSRSKSAEREREIEKIYKDKDLSTSAKISSPATTPKVLESSVLLGAQKFNEVLAGLKPAAPVQNGDKTRRKFTEDPKNVRRKFSEDPKLLEKSKADASMFKEKEAPAASKFLKPSIPELIGIKDKPPAKPKSIMKKNVAFKAPGAPVAFKAPVAPAKPVPTEPKPSALKMGALGNISAYDVSDDDSDDED